MEEANCPTGKRCYRSKADAYYCLGKVLKRRRQKQLTLSIYHCSECGWFHLGNNLDLADWRAPAWRRWWKRRK